MIAQTIGTSALPAEATAQAASMLVLKGDSVDAAVEVVEKLGATVLAPAHDRPQWAPSLRTAHLGAPDGTLLELQSY